MIVENITVLTMPRDYHRLAAPAVFCSNVSRSVRRHSPPVQRRSPPRSVSSRQRERLPEERECEYDDYAAEIASYNRLRRGDRNAASSASSTSRRTQESYYDDLTAVVAPQSNSYYYTSHYDTIDRLNAGVPVYRSSAACVSDNAILHDVSRPDHDDRQHRKHKKKRKHHHCHSRRSVGKHGENSSSEQCPRDTIAALKALANYDDVGNNCASSMKSAHHCGSPGKFQRKLSSERESPAVSCNIAGAANEVIMVTVSVNASSSPVVDLSKKDSLSPGECSDDDDGNMHTVQESVVLKSSPPHVTQSEHSCGSSSGVSNCVTTAVSYGESTTTVYCESTAHVTEDSLTHVQDTNLTCCIPSATLSTETESKADGEQLLIKDDENTANHSESQSEVQLKVTLANKEAPAVDDESNKISDEKQDTQRKSQSFRARRNYRKKSATDDERQTDADDAPLPRFVIYI